MKKSKIILVSLLSFIIISFILIICFFPVPLYLMQSLPAKQPITDSKSVVHLIEGKYRLEVYRVIQSETTYLSPENLNVVIEIGKEKQELKYPFEFCIKGVIRKVKISFTFANIDSNQPIFFTIHRKL